ncbi:PDZ and LIM domain protein 3-like [Pomacea canaliculata]|uniref:PDZ and LIM domain protein 3-like n=1 Tax=Pomacea canaliculata TaxID=400727 RepID=UPI000D73B9BD|nr:PDZ and LIM domain protein 3-like [Pomacea canaliculata]
MAAMVELRRNPGQPWGFRLQGGLDFGQQLTVKKVQPGTPSAGALTPGDTIVGIGSTNAKSLTHMQAHQLIKSAGNVLQLTLLRGQSTDFSAIKPKGPVKFSPWRQN